MKICDSAITSHFATTQHAHQKIAFQTVYSLQGIIGEVQTKTMQQK
jgi:hypothetical protein